MCGATRAERELGRECGSGASYVGTGPPGPSGADWDGVRKRKERRRAGWTGPELGFWVGWFSSFSILFSILFPNNSNLFEFK